MKLELYNLCATQIHEMFMNGEVSAEEIVLSFKERILSQEPTIGAFLSLFFEDAIQQAHDLDSKRSNGERLGSLAGIPVGVKDNIHMNGYISSCSSRILEHFVAVDDATVIEHLKNEDCILIGKLNMDEFAMGGLGTLSAFKQCKNPANIEHCPGGSSSGSAASVAAKMVPVSLGSDTGGSVRLPAAFCGVYGFKPSYGGFSRYGLVAFASSLDVIGILANSVEDISIFAHVMSRSCKYDSTKIDLKPSSHKDLKNIRVGICKEIIDSIGNECIKRSVTEYIEKLSNHVSIVEVSLLQKVQDVPPIYYTICCSEAFSNLARYDGVSFGERIEGSDNYFNMLCNTRRDLFGAEVKRRLLVGSYILSEGKKKSYYKKAGIARTQIMDTYDKCFKKCDFLIIPSTGVTAPKFGENISIIDAYLNDAYTASINIAKLPALSIPTGHCKNGLPTSVQLVGKYQMDFEMLDFANALSNII